MISLLFYGDISQLSQQQRAQHLFALAKKLGLDPASKPFDIIPVAGGTKLMVYANKGAAAQLQKNRNLSVNKIYAGALPINPASGEFLNDIYVVEVEVTSPDGRRSMNVGSVNIAGLKGDTLSNKIMACHTKAMRRAVLHHEGLGFTDESELESIPGVMKTLTPVSQPGTESPYTIVGDGVTAKELPAIEIPADAYDMAPSAKVPFSGALGHKLPPSVPPVSLPKVAKTVESSGNGPLVVPLNTPPSAKPIKKKAV